MKQLKGVCLLAVFVLFFSSCFTGFFPETKELIDGIERPHTTRVRFSNLGESNLHRVSVFSDSGRKSKIGNDIAPNSISELEDISQSFLFDFYLTFHLPIGGIEIPFNPSARDGGVLQEPIVRDQENTINIISLFTRISDHNRILVNDGYYIIIRNAGGPTFSFLTGNLIHNVVNGNEGDEYISNGNTGIYFLTQNNPNNPRIQVVGQPTALPPTNFERGKVYSFVYNGSSVSFERVADITLNNSRP
jgi:hypothetical protein